LKELLFVYGWLKKDHRTTFPELASVSMQFVSKAYLKGTLLRVSNYPGVLLDPQEYKVVGELYEVAAHQWQILDEFEHAWPLVTQNPEYRRVKAHATLEDGNQRECFVYEYLGNYHSDQIIENGVF
jgi:gamma-glutamylcyclotransferase (GGCT)/AIG2-like uncharacterized protein YtfP